MSLKDFLNMMISSYNIPVVIVDKADEQELSKQEIKNPPRWMEKTEVLFYSISDTFRIYYART